MDEKIKTYLNKMVKRGEASGRIEAKFGKLVNAVYFKKLLETNRMNTLLEERVGNASTLDTKPTTMLSKHFYVLGVRNTAHNILKKFV